MVERLVAWIDDWSSAESLSFAAAVKWALNARTVEGIVVALSSEPGLALADVYRWAALKVGAPDTESGRTVRDLLLADADKDEDEGIGDWRLRRQAWVALGDAGPVAWAAGVNLEEARMLLRSGSFDVAGMQILAGLRGWVFPPPYDARI